MTIFDDEAADQLLSEEERAEVVHIQRHFSEAEESPEKAAYGWRATTVYLGAFRREIVRLQELVERLTTNHRLQNCSCGHDEIDHARTVVCAICLTQETIVESSSDVAVTPN